MVVVESDEGKENDTRGQRSLDLIKSYNIRNANDNFAAAWNQVKTSALQNSWNKLLKNEERVLD